MPRGQSPLAVSDESTFCLQCWRVYSLQFRGGELSTASNNATAAATIETACRTLVYRAD
jgi:hypothetical protein